MKLSRKKIRKILRMKNQSIKARYGYKGLPVNPNNNDTSIVAYNGPPAASINANDTNAAEKKHPKRTRRYYNNKYNRKHNNNIRFKSIKRVKNKNNYMGGAGWFGPQGQPPPQTPQQGQPPQQGQQGQPQADIFPIALTDKNKKDIYNIINNNRKELSNGMINHINDVDGSNGFNRYIKTTIENSNSHNISFLNPAEQNVYKKLIGTIRYYIYQVFKGIEQQPRQPGQEPGQPGQQGQQAQAPGHAQVSDSINQISLSIDSILNLAFSTRKIQDTITNVINKGSIIKTIWTPDIGPNIKTTNVKFNEILTTAIPMLDFIKKITDLSNEENQTYIKGVIANKVMSINENGILANKQKEIDELEKSRKSTLTHVDSAAISNENTSSTPPDKLITAFITYYKGFINNLNGNAGQKTYKDFESFFKNNNIDKKETEKHNKFMYDFIEGIKAINKDVKNMKINEEWVNKNPEKNVIKITGMKELKFAEVSVNPPVVKYLSIEYILYLNNIDKLNKEIAALNIPNVNPGNKPVLDITQDDLNSLTDTCNKMIKDVEQAIIYTQESINANTQFNRTKKTPTNDKKNIKSLKNIHIKTEINQTEIILTSINTMKDIITRFKNKMESQLLQTPQVGGGGDLEYEEVITGMLKNSTIDWKKVIKTIDDFYKQKITIIKIPKANDIISLIYEKISQDIHSKFFKIRSSKYIENKKRELQTETAIATAKQTMADANKTIADKKATDLANSAPTELSGILDGLLKAYQSKSDADVVMKLKQIMRGADYKTDTLEISFIPFIDKVLASTSTDATISPEIWLQRLKDHIAKTNNGGIAGNISNSSISIGSSQNSSGQNNGSGIGSNQNISDNSQTIGQKNDAPVNPQLAEFNTAIDSWIKATDTTTNPSLPKTVVDNDKLAAFNKAIDSWIEATGTN